MRCARHIIGSFVDGFQAIVQPRQNPVSERFMTMIEMLRRQFSSEFMPVIVCKQGTYLSQSILVLCLLLQEKFLNNVYSRL